MRPTIGTPRIRANFTAIDAAALTRSSPRKRGPSGFIAVSARCVGICAGAGEEGANYKYCSIGASPTVTYTKAPS